MPCIAGAKKPYPHPEILLLLRKDRDDRIEKTNFRMSFWRESPWKDDRRISGRGE
jgi:hypothetical protein